MEKRSINEWKRVGIFGPLSHERTHLVKQTMDEMKEKQKGRVLIFDPHNHYGNTENEPVEGFTIHLLEVPSRVPYGVWAAALTEILAATLHLRHRASLILNKSLVELFALIKTEEMKQSPFLTILIKMIGRELEERKRETGGRLFFAEQEAYDTLLYSLHLLNEAPPSIKVGSTLNWKLDNPSENEPTVYSLFRSDVLQQTLCLNLVLAREFYTRKYDETMRKELLFVVIENPHLLFSKEIKGVEEYTKQSFVLQLLREAAAYGMHFIFVSESEEELSSNVLRTITKRHVVFENDLPQDKLNKKVVLFIDWDIQDENEMHALIQHKDRIYFVFDDHEKMEKANKAYAKWLHVHGPIKTISFSLLSELVKIS